MTPKNTFVPYAVLPPRDPESGRAPVEVLVRVMNGTVQRHESGMPRLYWRFVGTSATPQEDTERLWATSGLPRPNFGTLPRTILGPTGFTPTEGFLLAFPGKYALSAPGTLPRKKEPHTPRTLSPDEIRRARETQLEPLVDRDQWEELNQSLTELLPAEPRYAIAQRATKAYAASMSKRDPGVPGQRLNLTAAQAQTALSAQEKLIEEVENKKKKHAAARATTPHAFLSDIYARGVPTPDREAEDAAIRSYLLHTEKAMALSRSPEILPIERRIAVHLRNKNEGLYYQPRALTPAQEEEYRKHADLLIDRRLGGAKKNWTEAKQRFFPTIRKDLAGERWEHREEAIRSLTALLGTYGTYYAYLLPGAKVPLAQFSAKEKSVLSFIASVAKDIFSLYFQYSALTVLAQSPGSADARIALSNFTPMGINLSFFVGTDLPDLAHVLSLVRTVNSDRQSFSRMWIKANAAINNLLAVDKQTRIEIDRTEKAGIREMMKSRIRGGKGQQSTIIPLDLPVGTIPDYSGGSRAVTGEGAPGAALPGAPPVAVPRYDAPSTSLLSGDDF